jgi:hypothetical protein
MTGQDMTELIDRFLTPHITLFFMISANVDRPGK